MDMTDAIGNISDHTVGSSVLSTYPPSTSVGEFATHTTVAHGANIGYSVNAYKSMDMFYPKSESLQSYTYMDNTTDGAYTSSSIMAEIFMNVTGMDLNITLLNNTENATYTSPISLTYSLPSMIVVAVLLFVVTIATAFGNFLVGLALFKYNKLRTVSNFLIGNLALSDFLLAMTILPLSTVNECLGHWVFGEVLCNFWLCTDVLYCTASIWNLCIIALDRFTATLYPVWYREKRSHKQAALYIGFVWIFSIAISIAPLLGWNEMSQNYKYVEENNVYECMLFFNQSYVLYSASGSFFIPFLLTVFLYIKIFQVLRNRMVRMRATRAQNKQANHTKKAMLNNCPSALTTTEQTIELSTVPNSNMGETHTEELSSKSLFGSDSNSGGDNEEEESSSTHLKSDQPLYMSSSEAELPKRLLRNGLQEKGAGSEKLAILNPNHRFNSESEKDSDHEKLKVIITEDESTYRDSDADSRQPLQGVQRGGNKLTLSVPANVTHGPKTNGKQKPSKPVRKSFGDALKSSMPFRARKDHQQRKEQRKEQRMCEKRRYDQREVRATIRMAIIIACFCGCWLGFFLLYVINSWCKNCTIPRPLEAFFFWLGYSNSSMNPILYTIFNEDFRRAFQKLLGCYRKKPHGKHYH